MSFIRVSEPNVAAVELPDLGITIAQNDTNVVLSDKFAVNDLIKSADLEAAIIGGDLTVELDFGTGFTAVAAGDYTNRDTLGTFLNIYEITNENDNEDLVDGSDASALHIHDSIYYTETELSGTGGAALIGADDSAWAPGITFTTVQEFIDDLAGTLTGVDLDDVYDNDADGILNVDGTTKPLDFKSDNANDIIISRTNGVDNQNALVYDVSGNELQLGSLVQGGLAQTDVRVLSDLFVDGNITFVGTITDTTVANLNVTNANILLRDGATSGGDAALEVERGATGPDACVMWNEATDQWEVGVVGDKYAIARSSFDENITGNWNFEGADSNSPSFSMTEKSCATPPATNLGAAGEIPFAVMDDGQLYSYDKTNSRNKWLSVGRKEMTFNGRNSANNRNEYLNVGRVNTFLTGIRVEQNSTIVALTVQSRNTATYTVHIRRNGVATNIASLTVTAADGNQDITLNVDVDQGDEIQCFLEASVGIRAPIVNMVYANRCP